MHKFKYTLDVYILAVVVTPRAMSGCAYKIRLLTIHRLSVLDYIAH